MAAQSTRGGGFANPSASWLGYYLLVGLLFQLLYFGLPWPQYLGTWLHVLAWPVYVVLVMLRRLFIPFAFVALIGLGAVYAWTNFGRRRNP